MTSDPVGSPRVNSSPSARSAGIRSADWPPRHGAGGASFAASLARAGEPKASRPVVPPPGEPKATRPVVPPPGEKWEPVPGRSDYADIISGPRNGSYVNLTDGPRRGQAFNIVQRGSRTFHVYDNGRDRTVVEVKRQTVRDRIAEPRDGETWREVPGHPLYRLIQGGERDGKYINVSGNRRHGETFTIEQHNGHAHHVYTGGDLVHIVRRDGSGAARAR